MEGFKIQAPQICLLSISCPLGRSSPPWPPSSPRSYLFFRHSFWKAVFVLFLPHTLNTPHTHLFFVVKHNVEASLIAQWQIPCSQGMDSISVSEQGSCMTGTVQNKQINKSTMFTSSLSLSCELCNCLAHLGVHSDL